MRLGARLRHLWHNAFHRNRIEADLEDELRNYVDTMAARKAATGLSPVEARRTVLAAMGGVEQIKERCREARTIQLIEDFGQDLRFAVRALLKAPTFTAGAIVTLAIGIGGMAAIFSIVSGVLLRPLPFPNPDRLVMIWQDDPHGSGRGFLSPPDVPDLRQRIRSLESVDAYRPTTLLWKDTGSIEAERLPAVMVGMDTLRVLGVQPVIGRSFIPEDFVPNTNSVILTYSLWRRRFGADSSIVGRTIPVGNQKITVAGVMPPEFQFYPLNVLEHATLAATQPEVLVPLTISPQLASLGRNVRLLQGIGRFKDGLSILTLQNDLDSLSAQLQPEDPNFKDHRFVAVPMQSNVVESARSAIVLFFAAVGLVLLIAVTNVANLLVARAVHREREIALRLAIGSTPFRLVRTLTTESLLLSALGSVCGLALAKSTLGVIVHDCQLDFRALAILRSIFGYSPLPQWSVL